MKKTASIILGTLLLTALFLAAVSWNRSQVFVPRTDGGIFVILADGDCQARLQRAAMVTEHPGSIIRSHSFENYPQGTIPHTTAPMDYLIAAVGFFIHPLDIAGAWVSPLLGLVAVLFLYFWARETEVSPRWPMLLLFCLSPALTHAFALGRPDHQSLLAVLTTIALASNLAFTRTTRPAWAWASGAAWGLALWVSWFEPLILLVAQEVARGLALRRAAWPKIWRQALLLAIGIAITSWAFEGFRNPWPSPEIRELFPRWAALLGELQHANARTLFAWVGWLLVPAPLLMAWDYWKKRDLLALIMLVLLVVVTALAGWQVRWSPWLASIFCLALPWILRPLKKSWIIGLVFVISLWPVARAWEGRLMPSPAEQRLRQEKIIEAALLAQTAEYLREQPPGGVLAPWWISPALARLSQQPMVGGTSHQSLPGSADTARFFLATNDAEAWAILRARRVRYVVTDAPERVVPTSAALLGRTPSAVPLAVRLARGRSIPSFLEPIFANSFFCVYKVRDEGI